MSVIWSPHARARAAERGQRALETLHNDIRFAVRRHDWQEWWEFDEHERRGLRLNYLIRCADGTWALLRESETAFVVVSLLLPHQYCFNVMHIWYRTAEAAKATSDKPRGSGVRPSKPTAGLTHAPFAKLAKRSGT